MELAEAAGSLVDDVEVVRHADLAGLDIVLLEVASVLVKEMFQDAAQPLVLLSTPVLVVEVCGASSVVVARV